MSEGRFPKPYVSDVKKDESLMVYIPTEKMGIGATTAGLPNTPKPSEMRLEHVGGSAGRSGKK